VIVGYHNGAEIGTLSDDECPPAERSLAPDLAPIAAALRASQLLARHAMLEAKGEQIAIELLPFGDAAAVLAETTRLVRVHATCGKIAIVTSSHSVDVIAGGVSKSNVVRRLVEHLALADGGAASILCVGDLRDAAGAGDWCTAGIIDLLGPLGPQSLESADHAVVEAAVRRGQAMAARNWRAWWNVWVVQGVVQSGDPRYRCR
jgi:hypothetical protein